MSIEEDDYDVLISDNGKVMVFLCEKFYICEVWEEEAIFRVKVDLCFFDEFFLVFLKYFVENGIRLKFFRLYMSLFERILMEKFGVGEEV